MATQQTGPTRSAGNGYAIQLGTASVPLLELEERISKSRYLAPLRYQVPVQQSQVHQVIVILQIAKESCGKTRVTVVRPRNGTRHDGDSVGVVTAVDRNEQRFLEILGAGQEAPEGARE